MACFEVYFAAWQCRSLLAGSPPSLRCAGEAISCAVCGSMLSGGLPKALRRLISLSVAVGFEISL